MPTKNRTTIRTSTVGEIADRRPNTVAIEEPKRKEALLPKESEIALTQQCYKYENMNATPDENAPISIPKKTTTDI